jgi:NADH:ubiquinone oxidoreductase subunit 6 (subunit J)
MTIGLMILLVLVMAGVVYVLVRGVVGMASGRDVTGEQSQKWMQRRVLLQAGAIVIVILILIVAGSSGR